MKKIVFQSFLILLINLLFVISVSAQKPLATFFSLDGHKFTVIMDGKEINPEPRSRVEYVELDNDWAKVRIIFEDKNIESIDKTIQGTDSDGKISSVTWEIKQNSKGKWKVSPSSWKSIEEAKKEMAESAPVSEPAPVIVSESRPQAETTTTVVTTETVSRESRNPTGSSVAVAAGGTSMSMQIAVDDSEDNTNVSINMGVPGLSMTETESTTTYTSMSTTTTTTGSPEIAAQPRTETVEANPMPGYGGRTGCSAPLSNDRFMGVKNSISSKDFEDSKLTVAQQIIKSNCLQASQVKEIMNLFNFEDTKLEFAKEAYNHTYDIDNYYEINDAFSFESSIEELNEYISGR